MASEHVKPRNQGRIMKRGQGKSEFDISGVFDNIEDLNKATDGLRLMFDHKPKLDQPYRSRIVRRKFGPIILAEMESDPCIGVRRVQNTQSDEFVCVTSQLNGSLKQTQKNKSIEIDAGDLYIWDGQDPIMIDVKEKISVKTIWIHRSALHLTKQDASAKFFDVINRQNPIHKLLYNQVIDMHEIAGRLSGGQIMWMTNSIVQTLHCCLDCNDGDGAASDKELYYRICNYIKMNIYDMYLSVENMARDMQVGVRSIQRAFAAKGTTFGAYLRGERLREAARLLALPESRHLSLTELAHRLAFYDLAHFSRAFKYAFGCSPKEFRRRLWAESGCRNPINSQFRTIS
jgi:AraC-like DNA-binding protein